MNTVMVGRRQYNMIHSFSEIHFPWLQLIPFCNLKGIVDIFNVLHFQALKRMTYIYLEGLKFKNKDQNFNNEVFHKGFLNSLCRGPNFISIITRFITLVYQNFQRKVKTSEHFKVSHSKNPGREKTLYFTVGKSIMPPN